MESLPLPPAIFNTYGKIKADTDTLTKWLGEHAIECGYSFADNSIATSPRGKKKKKGKKQVREKNHKVKLSDFVPMAQVIVSASNGGFVPFGVPRLLRRIIRGRQIVAIHYAGIVGTEESNRTHQHPIRILQDVLNILADEFNRRQHQDTTPSGQEELENAPNAYDCLLELEDLNDSDVEIVLEVEDTEARQKLSESATARVAKKGKSTFVMANSEQDAYLKKFCIFKDFEALRIEEQKRWQRYLSGELTLIAASLTTDTAIEMLRRDDSPSDSTAKSSKSIYQDEYITSGMAVFETMCAKKGGSTFSQNSAIDPNMLDEAEFVCLPAYLALRKLLDSQDHSENREVTALEELSQVQRVGLNIDREVAAEGRMMENEKILQGIFHYAKRLVCDPRMPQFPAESWLIHAISECFQTGKISLWAVLTTQLFLDVSNVMREKSPRSWCELKMMAEVISKRLVAQTQLAKLSKHEELQSIVAYSNAIIRDHITVDPSQSDLKQKPKEEDGSLPESYLFRKHPMLCGLLAFRLKFFQLEIGRIINSKAMTFMPIVHLYNAARKRGNLEIWPDLEALIACYYESEIFLGERAAEGKDMYRRYLISGLGATVQWTAANGRTNDTGRIASSSTGRRVLHSNSLVVKIFSPRFLPEWKAGVPVQKSKFCDIEKLLEFEIQSASPELGVGIQTEDPLAHRSTASSSSALPANLSDRRRTLSLPKVLDSLCQRVGKDMKSFDFNYISMHKRSYDLLHEIGKSLGKTITVNYPKSGNGMHPDYTNPDKAWEIVQGILNTIQRADAMSEAHTAARDRARRGLRSIGGFSDGELQRRRDQHGSILPEATLVLAKFIAVRGDELVKEMEANNRSAEGLRLDTPPSLTSPLRTPPSKAPPLRKSLPKSGTPSIKSTPVSPAQSAESGDEEGNVLVRLSRNLSRPSSSIKQSDQKDRNSKSPINAFDENSNRDLGM